MGIGPGGQFLHSRTSSEVMVEHTAGSPLVLVVDDNPDVLKFIQEALQRSGYQVVVAWSAEEAFRVLETHTVAVVVLDLVLPGMGGMEFAWRLQERTPKPGLILISGYADGAAAISALDQSAVAFLDKPFDATDLVAKVQELIRSTNGS